MKENEPMKITIMLQLDYNFIKNRLQVGQNKDKISLEYLLIFYA